jgi:ribosome-binding factor A
MQGSRPVRLGEQIRQDLSEILANEVKDPGIGFLTVTFVKVSADLQVAQVYYTALGDERARRDARRALDRAAPFLRRQLAGRLRLRRAPELHFHYDESVERGERVERLLQEIHGGSSEPGSGDGNPDEPDTNS